jgi:uncharacterized protein
MRRLSCQLSRRRKLVAMTKRAHDPRRLDVAAAAAAGAVLSGQWPLAELSRLAEEAIGQGDQQVEWSASFEHRCTRAGPPHAWLHLVTHTRLWRECQRCLQPVALDLQVDRTLRFVATEDEAAALDAESEDDVLALSHRFDLLSLVEDELLLALPLVPKHMQCPATTPEAGSPPAAEGMGEATAAHPFAVLAALKRGAR